MQGRPEIASARINLTNLEISRKSIQERLAARRWTLTLSTARPAWPATEPAGSDLPDGTFTASATSREPFRPALPRAFTNLFNSSAPDKGIGLNLNIPIRNRAAQANQVRSDLEYRQAQVALQQTENPSPCRSGRRSSPCSRTMPPCRRRSRPAILPREPDRRAEEVHLRRFDAHSGIAGVEQSDQAESNVLNAAANYEKSKVNSDFTTSETLTKLGIDLSDAEAGKVKSMPTVNGVVPANVRIFWARLAGENQLTPPAQSTPPAQTTPPNANPGTTPAPQTDQTPPPQG